jgi:hypothetical protein
MRTRVHVYVICYNAAIRTFDRHAEHQVDVPVQIRSSLYRLEGVICDVQNSIGNVLQCVGKVKHHMN